MQKGKSALYPADSKQDAISPVEDHQAWNLLHGYKL
jgi:hypothetical protein